MAVLIKLPRFSTRNIAKHGGTPPQHNELLSIYREGVLGIVWLRQLGHQPKVELNAGTSKVEGCLHRKQGKLDALLPDPLVWNGFGRIADKGERGLSAMIS